MAFSLTELRLSTSFSAAASILHLVSCSNCFHSLSHHEKGSCVEEKPEYNI